MANSPTHSEQPPLRQFQVVGELLENPVLARMYAYALTDGPVTVAELIDNCDVPQGTAYDYVDRLEAVGLLESNQSQRPHVYEATPVSLTLETGCETQMITPPLIASIARRETDGDIDLYIERHGLDGLAVALEYAFEYVDGTVNNRIMSRELGISPLEAEIILQALEPVALAYGRE